jgi:hypothetical protein
MTDRPPLKSYTFEGYYSDDPGESGPRTDCVLAPDRDTAIRLAAAAVLTDNEWSLEDRDYAPTLREFHDAEITISYEWVQGETGRVCPACTSDQQRPDGSHFDLDGATREVMECRTCGHRWLSLDYGEARAKLEAHAWHDIDTLDRFERLSRLGDDAPTLDEAVEEFRDDPSRETAQVLRDTADQYHDDGMIGPDTWGHWCDAASPYLKEE